MINNHFLHAPFDYLSTLEFKGDKDSIPPLCYFALLSPQKSNSWERMLTLLFIYILALVLNHQNPLYIPNTYHVSSSYCQQTNFGLNPDIYIVCSILDLIFLFIVIWFLIFIFLFFSNTWDGCIMCIRFFIYKAQPLPPFDVFYAILSYVCEHKHRKLLKEYILFTSNYRFICTILHKQFRI